MVLPELQGFGVGPQVSEKVGGMVVRSGGKLYSKTAHPRLGEYRDGAAPLWRSIGKIVEDPSFSSLTKSFHNNIYNGGSERVQFTVGKERTSWRHQYMGTAEEQETGKAASEEIKGKFR